MLPIKLATAGVNTVDSGLRGRVIGQNSQRLEATLAGQHGVGLRHLIQRDFAISERKAIAVVIGMLREAVDSQQMQPVHESILTHELQSFHGRYVQRVAQGFAQPQQPILPVAVVVEGMLTTSDGFRQVGVINQGCSGPAALQSQRIQQGLHG